MDNSQWISLIENNFTFLFSEYGFRITENYYYPKHFGNRRTFLESSRFHIEIEIDRSHLTISISPIGFPSFNKYLTLLVGYLNNQSASSLVNRSDNEEVQLQKASNII